QEVTRERILEDKFTIIDGKNKMTILTVQPNTGPDTGERVTISGQFIGSLNIEEFKRTNTDPATVSESPDPSAVEVHYGPGTYGTGTNKIDIESAVRTIRVIIGNKASFIKDKNANYELSFDKDLVRVIVLT